MFWVIVVADVGGAEVPKPPTLTTKTAAESGVHCVAASGVVSSRCFRGLGRCPRAQFIADTWDRVTEHVAISAGLQMGEVSQQKK